jgi:hypothetical protein
MAGMTYENSNLTSIGTMRIIGALDRLHNFTGLIFWAKKNPALWAGLLKSRLLRVRVSEHYYAPLALSDITPTGTIC